MDNDSRPRCEFEEDRLLLKLDVNLAATVAGIDPAVVSIMKIVDEMGCAEGKEFEIETALRESLANAIIHGAGDDPDKQVQVCVGCDEDRGMIIVVRDPGDGFDPADIASPVVGERLFASHGRGIYLINELMDEVHIRRGGTEIWMKKR